MHEWFELRKLKRLERRFDRAYLAVSGEQARKEWYAEHQWEIIPVCDAISEIESRRLVKRARRHNIPVPHDSWTTANTGLLVLTDDVMREIQSAVTKASRESVEHRFKVAAWVIGIPGALIAAIVGLNSLRAPSSPVQTAALPPITAPAPDNPQSEPVEPETPLAAPRNTSEPPTPQPQARLRILDVRRGNPSSAPFPGLNIHYNNAGPLPTNSIASRWSAAFAPAPFSLEAMNQAQDNILHWDGWESEMAKHQQEEMNPGDAGDYTSIPNSEGVLADFFRADFDNMLSGTRILQIFLTFKFRDSSTPANMVIVTEECFWFSGNLARHNCGRRRTFLEQRPQVVRP